MPRVSDEWLAGFAAGSRGEAKSPPADYTAEQRKLWLSGYDLARSPIAK